MSKTASFLLPAIFFLFQYTDLEAQHTGRDAWQQPERLMDSIGVKAGMIIGEPGAGDGYFTLKMARRIGAQGKIYANDIDRDKLASLRKKSVENGLRNITTILGEVEDPLLPDSSMDMIVMVYVFHDLEKPVVFLKNLLHDLKQGAKLFLVERDPARYGGEHKHFLTRDGVVAKVKAGGFRVEKIIDDFPRDNLYICVPESQFNGQ